MSILLLLWGLVNMIIIIIMLKEKPQKLEGNAINTTLIDRINYLETLKCIKSYE